MAVESIIVTGVRTGVGFSNVKNYQTRKRTRIQKFCNKSGVGVRKTDSGNLCRNLRFSFEPRSGPRIKIL